MYPLNRPSAAFPPWFRILVAAFLAAANGHAAGSLPTPIETARATVEASALDEGRKQAAIALLETAQSEARTADALEIQLAELRAEATSQPARAAQLQKALTVDRDQALQAWEQRLPTRADPEMLERVLAEERDTIADLDAQIDDVGAELVKTLSRPAQAANDIGRLSRRIEELTAPVTPAADEEVLVTEARRLRQENELRRTRTELALRQLEQDTAANRLRLYELTQNELRYRKELHVRRATLLQARIVETARAESAGRVARLAEEAAALADSPAPIAATAAQNLAIGERLMAQNERLADDRAALARIEEARLDVATFLRTSRARLELAGTSEAVGRWLWSERRRLEPTARLRQELEELRGQLAEERLERVTLYEEKRSLVDLPGAARALAEASRRTADEGEADTLAAADLEPLLAERAELLTLLEPLLERRIEVLEQSERAKSEQIDLTVALRQLLDRHLLWAPSHAPLNASWLARVPEGLYDLVKPSRFVTTLELSATAFTARPWPWIGNALLLAGAIVLRLRAPRRIETYAAVTRHLRGENYGASLKSLGWTIAAALPAPLAVWLLGDLLQSVGTPGRYSFSLGRALDTLVVPLLALQLLRWTAVERGLGHAHFRWMRARRETLRRLLPVTAAVVLPTYFVSSLAFVRNLDLPNDVQARLAIVIACTAIAVAVWRALDAGRIWVVRGVETEPSMLRKLLRVAIPIAVMAIAALAVLGYVYSAGILMVALLATFTLTVAITLATGMLGRWLLLAERRLAWSRLEERRAAAAAADQDSGEVLPEAEAEVTLEQVNAQTRRLLRALRLTLAAVGFVWVWADILPAFARLDEIALWHLTEVGPDGGSVLAPVTLMAVLLGAFVLALTVVAARNLPGLIEIGLQSYTRIDAASRYAITSIMRYAIVIAGVVAGLGLLGLRWSQLQWMAAALTVGLGFGLQEIFANFVSGLILLFERPFRVGDIITVGDLSGRVTRIRTRATTILDFDNKEIVVPNKTFITGQLVNWTLTDTTTRITIKVGVAYGTRPQRVHELLKQAAREHPLVLAEPEPQSWFLAFGASSLDFELRVFVSAIVDRLPVQDRLNSRIAELFAEHGIEIAFPQLDLHVRDLPDAAPST
ncbi:MAG: mechanosensitive ion channel domain-containing protein [Pseudomonadales bacterium]